jgi:hypothetical protein
LAPQGGYIGTMGRLYVGLIRSMSLLIVRACIVFCLQVGYVEVVSIESFKEWVESKDLSVLILNIVKDF